MMPLRPRMLLAMVVPKQVNMVWVVAVIVGLKPRLVVLELCRKAESVSAFYQRWEKNSS